jgi:hypothetical protein
VVVRRRPTLPHLKMQYHGRSGVSRPSSGWDRVYHPRDDHRTTAPDPDGWCGVRMGLEGWLGLVCVYVAVWCCVRVLLWAGFAVCWGYELYRAIRTARLRGLPHFHLRPIDVMVYHGPRGRPRLEGGFLLRCLQQLSRPHLATQRCSWRNNWYTRGTSIPVLSY